MIFSDIFTVVSSALIQTGNQPPVQAYDGTDEWVAGQNSYDLWLTYCLEAYDWNFNRNVTALTRVGPSVLPQFTDAYQIPDLALHIISCWPSDKASTAPVGNPWNAGAQSNLYPLQYKIVGQAIMTTAPNGLTAEWIARPQTTDNYTAIFRLALVAFVSSSLYASLNEDLASAEKTYEMAEQLLAKAAERVKEQHTRRTPFIASPLAPNAFTIISSALIQVGGQPPAAAWDGTDDWVDGWNAYQIWLPYCLEAYDWSFQRTTQDLTRTGTPPHPPYTDIYAIPANCLHLISCYPTDQIGVDPARYVWDETRPNLFPVEYKIIGQSIYTFAPNGLTIEFLTAPSNADAYSAMFNLALSAHVAASLYAARNKEPQVAEKMMADAKALLAEAVARCKEQQNRRTPFLAGSLAADPFTIISSALIQVGAQPPATAWNGTDDWIDGWNAYSVWLPYCLEARDWNFQTNIVSLVRVGAATYPRFSDAYSMPPDCLHLQTVWRPDLAGQMPGYMGWGMTEDSIRPPQIEYRIVGNVIETSAPAGLMAKYLTKPLGTDTYSATFNLALSAFVAASLYSSRNKDGKSAAAMKQQAMQLLEEAASRTDQQENRRVAFRSRMLERRRARYAPWGSPL